MALLTTGPLAGNPVVIFSTDFSTATQVAVDSPVVHNGFVLPGFTVSDFTKGAGLGPFRIDDSGVSEPEQRYLSEPAGTNNSSFDLAFLNDAYIEFTVASAVAVAFARIDFNLRGNGSTQVGYVTLRSSMDDFAADLATVSGTMNTVHPMVVDLSPIEGFSAADQVTFRFYLYDNYVGQNNRRIGIDAVSLYAQTGIGITDVFGPLTPLDGNRFYAENMGQLEFLSDTWIRHETIGWMYADPPQHENWVYAIDTGWLYLRSDLLPWYLSVDTGWAYHFVSEKPTPIGEQELQLHPLFTDHMVLQRDRPIRFFGSGTPGYPVRVAMNGITADTQIDEGGKWLLEMAALAASSDPRQIVVTSASESITLNNVLIGDVWLGSGQSNMARAIRGSPAQPVSADNRNHPHVRIATVAVRTHAQPQDFASIDALFGASWQECSGALIDDFSALGFYFSTYLQRQSDVPVGIIISARGATRIESWCSLQTLVDTGIIDAGFVIPDAVNFGTPTALYNAMIHPLRDFNFKGVIWYQGEGNANQGDPDEYAALFPAMIEGWRQLLRDPDLPFLFVQLAPFRANNAPADNWPRIREAQAQALQLANTGMAVITDAGEFADIHPQDKRSPGERLALLAREIDGHDVRARSPLFERLVLPGDGRAEVHFMHAESGLQTRRVAMNRQVNLPPGEDPQAFVVEASSLQGFELQDANGQWFVAAASIVSPDNGGTDFVELYSVEVPNPVAVRYGWANFPLCNLYNGDGLPASPFRSHP